MQDPAAIKTDILMRARSEGFDLVRVADAAAEPQNAVRLRQYLDAGHHGAMGWMAERASWRADPQAMWPGAKSVIVLGLNYGPAQDPLAILAQKDRAAISVYAQGDDYHDVVKKKLKALAGHVVRQFGGDVKVFVDTAPVMEKPLAQAAGVGWQGKHTNLVSREHGSWLFLGVILTSVELEPDVPADHGQHCGTCSRCLDACPTNAFNGPHRIDARRCISYLTIEHDGPIPHEFRPAMGNRIYGCDDCLAVCPWNRFADAAAANRAFLPRAELAAPRLADLLALDDASFREMFSGSPIKRIGVKRMIRNCLIAAGNSGDVSLEPSVREYLNNADPVIAEAAEWALDQLGSSKAEIQAA